ncbi:o-succinylbenzoate--CoA ligase [Tepidibacillus sp. HK-1]|uniref:o-succinylbenzoate--CoA ligase n=1 Tax=Tepidibacillus sp. HK-1 TaxID=1883407 RepID=UPI000852BF76|nr:o-succinylbenzoate--CoA ligase [Tepidibacillus sp. HK-1]GBF12256.1 2-succinylbenzoate--CoA ligase [Tepidibacillus sp. HK-1]
MEEKMLNWLYKRAELTPNRIALQIEGQTWTFSELHQNVRMLAYRMYGLGMKKGDHVAFLLNNDLYTVEIIHALTYVGAVVIPLNTRLSRQEIAYQLQDAKVDYLLFDQEYAEQVPEPNGKGLSVVRVEELYRTKLIEGAIQTEIDLNQTFTILYTSGTTGKPKGVMLTYGNHWWSAIGSALNLGLDVNDRWLACLPFFHVSGLSILVRSVVYGIAVVLHKKFDAKKVNQSIKEDRVTLISVVSTMLSQMIEDLGDSSYPESLRCVLLGGGSIPQPLLAKSKQLAIPVFQTYGMTETASQIVTLAPEYMLDKLGSAGKPLFPSQIKIVDGDREMKAGEAGEIVVKGFNVTKGYFGNEQATNEVIYDGWLRTGDIGYLDQDGFLFVLDRRKDLIISGGENIYPAEVESVILEHPAIEEAGVVGQSDPKWGQIPVAFVKVKEGQEVTEADLISFCKERLAKYKVPVSFTFVDELPRNAAKKLLRRKLVEQLQSK